MDEIFEWKGEQIPRNFKKFFSGVNQPLLKEISEILGDQSKLPHLLLRIEKTGNQFNISLTDTRTGELVK